MFVVHHTMVDRAVNYVRYHGDSSFSPGGSFYDVLYCMKNYGFVPQEVMVTSNCLTGEANYFEEKQDKKRLIDIVRASSSLPLMCPIAYVDNQPMLDGGIVDSIPLMRAYTDGCTRNVVILTRNRGYREAHKDIRVPSFIYPKYPKMREVLSKRCAAYNEQLEMVERMEELSPW